MIRILPDGEDTFVLLDGDTPCGSAKVAWGETLHILSVEAPDDLLREGMIRSVLNSGRVRGIPVAVCTDERLYPLLRHLEFFSAEEGMAVDIAAFFGKGCSSHK